MLYELISAKDAVVHDVGDASESQSSKGGIQGLVTLVVYCFCCHKLPCDSCSCMNI